MRQLSKRPGNKSAPHLRRQLGRMRREGAQARSDLAQLLDAQARLQARFDLLREATSDGLWDVELGERKLMDPAKNSSGPIRCGAWSAMVTPVMPVAPRNC